MRCSFCKVSSAVSFPYSGPQVYIKRYLVYINLDCASMVAPIGTR